jgi:hypothetical protein
MPAGEDGAGRPDHVVDDGARLVGDEAVVEDPVHRVPRPGDEAIERDGAVDQNASHACTSSSDRSLPGAVTRHLL